MTPRERVLSLLKNDILKLDLGAAGKKLIEKFPHAR